MANQERGGGGGGRGGGTWLITTRLGIVSVGCWCIDICWSAPIPSYLSCRRFLPIYVYLACSSRYNFVGESQPTAAARVVVVLRNCISVSNSTFTALRCTLQHRLVMDVKSLSMSLRGAGWTCRHHLRRRPHQHWRIAAKMYVPSDRCVRLEATRSKLAA